MSRNCHDDAQHCETSAIDCLQDGNEGILVPEIESKPAEGQKGPFAKRLEKPGGHDSPGSIEVMTPTGSPSQSRGSSPVRTHKQRSPARSPKSLGETSVTAPSPPRGRSDREQ